MELSKRLKAVSGLVTKGNRVADIGTDHGYVPIYLVESGNIPGAIAMDINRGPVLRAKKHILEHGLSDYIETRLSDGVGALKQEEADSLVIAGMGGRLMVKILTEGTDVLQTIKELVLQPQSEIFLVRKFLQQNGYEILTERIVLEEGKYYPMMKAVKGFMNYDKEIFFRYGKILLENRDEILGEFLEKEKKSLQNISQNLEDKSSEAVKARKQELAEEIQLIKEALEYFDQTACDSKSEKKVEQ